MKKTLASVLVAVSLLSACSESDVASQNLSKAADMFEVTRRVVFYNGITGEYMLTIQGLCALGNTDPSRQLTVTCKTSPTQYKKHFLGLSNNVTYFVEQIEGIKANPYQYRVIFKPLAILPDIEIR